MGDRLYVLLLADMGLDKVGSGLQVSRSGSLPLQTPNILQQLLLLPLLLLHHYLHDHHHAYHSGGEPHPHCGSCAHSQRNPDIVVDHPPHGLAAVLLERQRGLHELRPLETLLTEFQLHLHQVEFVHLQVRQQTHCLVGPVLLADVAVAGSPLGYFFGLVSLSQGGTWHFEEADGDVADLQGLKAEDGDVEGVAHRRQGLVVEVAELFLVDRTPRICYCLLAAESALQGWVFEDRHQFVAVMALSLELGTGEGAVIFGLEEEEEGGCAPEGEDGEGGGEEEEGEEPGAFLLDPLQPLVQEIHGQPIHTFI